MEINSLAFLFDMEPLISHLLPIPQVFLPTLQLPHFLTPPSISTLIRNAQALRQEREDSGKSPFMAKEEEPWFCFLLLLPTLQCL